MTKERREKIKAQKVAFITKKLDLTSEEAQVFWPVYNEYEKEKDKLHEERHVLMEKIIKNYDTIEDAEMEDIADKLMELDIKDINLRKKYYENYKTILPIRKVVELQKSEHDFKHFLLRQIRGDQRSERGHGEHGKKGPRGPGSY